MVIFAASPPSAPPLHGVLMGKVYFYALDLARISASQALLMGKVPTTKLDLARLRAVYAAIPIQTVGCVPFLGSKQAKKAQNAGHVPRFGTQQAPSAFRTLLRCAAYRPRRHPRSTHRNTQHRTSATKMWRKT